MQLIVLGMHRSGTSVLARLLNMAGAYFGPEGISTGANKENPKGFWERRDVRSLSDLVLHSAGCDWDRVRHFQLGRVPDSAAKEFAKKAGRLILEMDAHRPWVLKEPRLCLLLPMWRPFLESPICIQILRHPVEVASSLRVRNGMEIEVGLALWERYVTDAAEAAHGLPSILVSHDALVQRPVEEFSKLISALTARGVRGLRMPSGQEIMSFFCADLYRERKERADLRRFDVAPQVLLFNTAIDSGGLAPMEKHQIPSSSIEVLASYESSLEPLSRPEQRDPEKAVSSSALPTGNAALNMLALEVKGVSDSLAALAIECADEKRVVTHLSTLIQAAIQTRKIDNEEFKLAIRAVEEVNTRLVSEKRDADERLLRATSRFSSEEEALRDRLARAHSDSAAAGLRHTEALQLSEAKLEQATEANLALRNRISALEGEVEQQKKLTLRVCELERALNQSYMRIVRS